MDKKYVVKSIFRTFQGEGYHVGKMAVFVRFVGCNLWSGYDKDRGRDSKRYNAVCPRVCDTDFTRRGSSSYTSQELVNEIERVSEGKTNFVVFTGGEPLLQFDDELRFDLHAKGYYIAIETNGTCSIEDIFGIDWISCSPKLPEEHLKLEIFDELKILYPTYHPKDYLNFAKRTHSLDVQEIIKWIQPVEWGNGFIDHSECLELLEEYPDWRMGIQAHKVWSVE